MCRPSGSTFCHRPRPIWSRNPDGKRDKIKLDNRFQQPGTATVEWKRGCVVSASLFAFLNQGNEHTAHLKHSGCQSLSNTLTLEALSSPSFGAMGRLHAQQRGANFLENIMMGIGGVESSLRSSTWALGVVTRNPISLGPKCLTHLL